MALWTTNSYGDFQTIIKNLFGKNVVIFYGTHRDPEVKIPFRAYATSFASPHVIIFKDDKQPDSFHNYFPESNVSGSLEHAHLLEVTS